MPEPKSVTVRRADGRRAVGDDRAWPLPDRLDPCCSDRLGRQCCGFKAAGAYAVRFDLIRVMRTNYLIDDFQKTYFVLESFDQLFHAGYDTDFAPIYDRFANEDGYAPTQVLPTDRVFTNGTQRR